MMTLSLLMQLASPAYAQASLTTTALNLGRLTKLTVTGATPGQLVYFTMSTSGLGNGPCTPTPNVCADTLNPLIIGTMHANASGQAWLYIPLNPQTLSAGQMLYFQAFPKSGRRFTETTVVSGPVVQPAYTRCYDPGVDAPVLRVPTAVQTTFENKPLYYYMPANPRGVMFYFHGGSEGAAEALKNEQTALMWNQMGINENFGVVAIDRDDMRNGGAWDTSTPANSNPDSQRMNRLRTWLVNNTGMNANTPVVLTGFSDGAAMATTFANHALNNFNWPVVVATPHNAAFGDTPDIDTAWTIGANDNAPAIQGLSGMQADMNRAGTPNQARTAPERVVTASTFLREPTWELADGQTVMADMQAYGLIDAQGRRLVPDNQIDTEIDAWAAQTTVSGASIAASRMKVLWATHRYTAYDNQAECDWIRDRIP